MTMLLQNSWIAHLHAENKSDASDKNFDLFINATEAKNIKMTKSLR